MEKYESKQVQILRPASDIYATLSELSNFTPFVADKVEGWEATADTCSFRAKGFTVKLRIVEREENKLVKITGDDPTPLEFFFWVQLHEVSPADTRMRLVLHVELNMMMRMMIGGKIQEALDGIAAQVAQGINERS